MSETINTTERVALVTWQLATTGTITAVEAATMTGLSVRGCQSMLLKMSATIPITNVDGRWYAVSAAVEVETYEEISPY